MSLTSYRAAPPRVTVVPRQYAETKKPPLGVSRQRLSNIMNGLYSLAHPPATMPGGDLLFQRLSVSTIGAVRFHGRVRDGIGWVTDAMATKQ